MTARKHAPRTPAAAPKGRRRGRPARAPAAARGRAHGPAAAAPDLGGAILDAAYALIGERGLDGVSMRDVAQQAGVTKALVYYYHQSKEQLFEHVLERYYEAHLAALAQAFAAQGSIRERLHGLFDAYLDFIETQRRFPRLVQTQLAGPSELHPVIERSLGALLTWTTHALDGVAPAEGPLAARQLFVTFSGIVVHYFTFAPALTGTWGRPLLGPEALAERRAHVHWMVDLVLDGLLKSRDAAVAPAPGAPPP